MRRVLLSLLCMVSLSAYAQHTVVVNPDGTHSVVVNNGNSSTIVNPDGSHSTAIHNGNSTTIVNPNGTHSTAIHNGNSSTIVNPDGSHSTAIHNGNSALLTLPLYASGQQKINRKVAGLTLGRYYRVSKVQDVILDKFSCLSRNYQESSSTSFLAIGSIPFAGEQWKCLNVVLESTGKVCEITFGKDFTNIEDANSYFLKVCEKVVSKYGKPVTNTHDDSFECLWEDNHHTQLYLQLIPGSEPDGSVIWNVWLSYEDGLLVQKITSDIFNEL